MQTKQLLLWIALTILLHWSEAQQDKIEEPSWSAEPQTDTETEQMPATTPSDPTTEVKPTGMELQNDRNSTGDGRPEEPSMGTADMPSSGEHLDLGPQIEEKPPMDAEDLPTKEEEKETNPENIPTKEKEKETNPEDIPTKDEEKDTQEPTKGTVDIPAPVEPTEEAPEIPAQPKPVESEHTATSNEMETDNIEKDTPKPPAAETASKPDAPAVDYQDDAPMHEDTTEQTPATTQPTPATTKPTPPPPAPTPAPTPALPVPLFPSINCFSCMNCTAKPKNKTKCAMPGEQRNGCFTLIKSEEKLVLRGCISELAETGNNYCKQNAKGCQMCYEAECNGKEVTLSSAAAAPLLGHGLIWSICIIISCLLTM